MGTALDVEIQTSAERKNKETKERERERERGGKMSVQNMWVNSLKYDNV